MDAALAISIVSALAAIGSLVVAAIATRNAWVSKEEAREAKDRAERSAAASERSAEAAETYSDISRELFEAGKVRIHIELDASAPDRGFIVNHGTHNAYDVYWDSPKHIVHGKVETVPVLSPGVRIPFFLTIAWGEFDTRFNVYYRDSEHGSIRTVQFVL